MAKITSYTLCTHFAGMTEALREAGLEPSGRGVAISNAGLLEDWGAVARKLGAVPTSHEYRRFGRYSTSLFNKRFHLWRRVPETFLMFANSPQQNSDWADVVKIITLTRNNELRALTETCGTESSIDGRDGVQATQPRRSRKSFDDRPVYGSPLLLPGLAHEPTNESGVIFVFALVAHRLGFVVERLQSAFPDCEALRQVHPGRWQRVSIEFEYDSRSFEKHGHQAGGCDLIVCWIHNWAECPETIEVIALSEEIRRSCGAGSRPAGSEL